MLPETSERVPKNTTEKINAVIQGQTEANVLRCASAGPEAIDRRLAELSKEWDVERWVETLASSFTLTGLILGLALHPAWFILPFVVQAFFLQHALQGWCPPVPFLRRSGVRTMAEIDEERYALKALRGDFQEVAAPSNGLATARAHRVLAAVHR
jgi:hypothetical protein